MPGKFFTGLFAGCIFTLSGLFLFNTTTKLLHPSSTDVHSSLVQDHNLYSHPKMIISTKATWTNVEAIEQSLKNMPPMHVGFDIDDTVLFPNTSFYIYTKKYCPEDMSQGHKKCLKQQAFWDDLNSSAELCPPKEIGKQLIQMHKKRGDKIYFITAREKSKYKPENLTQTLKHVFGLNDIHQVIYVGIASINVDKPGKTQAIKDNNIKIYYGDSDADIAAALAADARGIRVMRAANSQDNLTMPINGRFGEEVIMSSDI